MNDRINPRSSNPADDFLRVIKKRSHSRKLTHRFRQSSATKKPRIARIARHQSSMQLTCTDQLRQVRFFLSERRRRLEAFHLNGKIAPNVNFPTRHVPIHVGGLEAIFIEQKTPGPNHRRGAIAKATDFLSPELTGVIEFTFAEKDVALAWPALEKDRQCDVTKTFFTRAKKRSCGIFSYVPLALGKAIMAFTGAWFMRNIKLVAVNADLSVDQRSCAWMIRKTHRNAMFGHHCHLFSRRIVLLSVWSLCRLDSAIKPPKLAALYRSRPSLSSYR